MIIQKYCNICLVLLFCWFTAKNFFFDNLGVRNHIKFWVVDEDNRHVTEQRSWKKALIFTERLIEKQVISFGDCFNWKCHFPSKFICGNNIGYTMTDLVTSSEVVFDSYSKYLFIFYSTLEKNDFENFGKETI